MFFKPKSYQEKQRQKHMKLTAELPAHQRERLRMEQQEQLMLADLEKSGRIEPNLDIAEKLHKRSVKRKSNNH